ncbi:Metallo-dependent phosphatase-like protein [Russula dissimulans]|nr:Metallo-dependent phosphatase-like protein [Russula dissimulans]
MVVRAIALVLGGALVLSAGPVRVVACRPNGEHAHQPLAHAPRPSAQPPTVRLTPPSRPLVWGDVNIIHTTDSHGWLLGHQKTSFPEPNYSGDFGDFASFVAHMKKIAEEKDVNLLLADTGDLHDGTGLTDGFPPGGVDAHEANKFLDQLPYDVLAIGNHDLYNYSNTLDMYLNFAPKFPGRYLASNVNITITHPDGTAVSVPVGSRFAKSKTRKGRMVTSLGVLFSLTGNDNNTTVQPVADMVKEAWFTDAIKEEPNFFLLLGHMPAARDNWPIVFHAVRAVHPTTPILILGGHSHIRDCLQFDGRSIALESGRYMETVGVDLDKRGSTENLTVNRRYLDPNRMTYEFHTKHNYSSFDTSKGLEITNGLKELAKRFDLSFKFGTAPQDYTLSRNPFPSNGSVLSLMADEVLPTALTVNNSRANNPKMIIANSGALRFDIYAGLFTKNDQLTASPFDDAFLYIPGVPLGVAHTEHARAADLERYGRGEVEVLYGRWLAEMHSRAGPERRATKNLTLGYVTHDGCPGVGDDTLHTPLPFFETPNYISSPAPTSNDGAMEIDLVFVHFIESLVLDVLNGKKYTSGDVYGVRCLAEWNPGTEEARG